MMEAARTSETSVDNYFTRQYIPEDNSELPNLKLSTSENISSNGQQNTTAIDRFILYKVILWSESIRLGGL